MGQCWHVALGWVGNEKGFSMYMAPSGSLQVSGYRVTGLAGPCAGGTWEATEAIQLSVLYWHYGSKILCTR